MYLDTEYKSDQWFTNLSEIEARYNRCMEKKFLFDLTCYNQKAVELEMSNLTEGRNTIGQMQKARVKITQRTKDCIEGKQKGWWHTEGEEKYLAEYFSKDE